jgi:hypothetical protein
MLSFPLRQNGCAIPHPITQDSLMIRFLRTFVPPALAALSALAAAFLYAALDPSALAQAPASDQQPPAASAPAQAKENSELPAADSGVARGKKLVLKDGSFQVVREYQKNGDRVRYYSLERGQWEELPAAMVDWDATAKAEASEQKQDQALLATVHHLQEEDQSNLPLDVDASLIIAPNVFLPSGEGMFVLEGETVRLLDQVASEAKTDKKKFLERVLIPVPIVPDKKNIDIPGAHAKIRVNSDHPEFYLREAPPDPDRVSPVLKSSRPGESGPEVELVRATVKGNKRQLESVSNLFGAEVSEQVNTISLQTWPVTPNVYRFTLSEPLPPGEYALAEILPDGMNLYVWDFGVDAQPERKP